LLRTAVKTVLTSASSAMAGARGRRSSILHLNRLHFIGGEKGGVGQEMELTR
jgi:hypothetical protein